MAPKKRAAADQPTLEERTGAETVTKKRSRKGKLDKPEVQESAARGDLFKRRQALRSGTEAPQPEQKPKEAEKQQEAGEGGKSDAGIWVNRAPVLTLWVAVVAQRQGFSRNSGLTFGKAIAGLLAQSKGKAIGVFEKREKDDEAKDETQHAEEDSGVQKVDVFGMHIKGVKQGDDVLAIDRGTTAVKPGSVQTYLSKALGPRLSDAESALQHLADGYSPEDIGGEAYRLYETFRPSVPTGQQGWGRKGLLELDRIREMRP